MSETMPRARSVAWASSKRRCMFSRNAGPLLPKLDHLLSQRAECLRGRRVRGVLGDGTPGQGRLAELHRDLDHGVEDSMVAELLEVFEHLARQHRSTVVERRQQAEHL